MEIKRMYECLHIVDDSEGNEVTYLETDSQFNIVPRVGETLVVKTKSYETQCCVVEEVFHNYDVLDNNTYHHIYVYVKPKGGE